MTETKPAVRQPDPQLDRLARVGQWLAASEAGGKDANSRGAQAALRLYFAEALGLPALAASEVSVINGRLFISAKLLRGLAAKHGYRVIRAKGSDEKSCTAVLLSQASGEELGRYTFTLADAQRAKLVRDGSAWQSHPARMLWARAAKYVLDDYAPEVTLGLGTDDELEEIEGSAGTPVGVAASAEGASDVVSSVASPAPPDAEDGQWTEEIPDPEPREREETEQEKRVRLHRQLAVILDRNESEAKLPDGFESWLTYSRYLAKQKFGVDSRGDLNSEQLVWLNRFLKEEAVPF